MAHEIPGLLLLTQIREPLSLVNWASVTARLLRKSWLIVQQWLVDHYHREAELIDWETPLRIFPRLKSRPAAQLAWWSPAGRQDEQDRRTLRSLRSLLLVAGVKE